MNFFKALRQPIHKGDIMPVIRQGIFTSLTGGMIVGALHLLMTYLFQFSLTWLMLFVVAHYISRRIRYAYESYHLVYSLYSVLCFFLAYVFMSVTLYAGLYFLYGVTDFSMYLRLLIPWGYFDFLNPLNPQFFTTFNLFEVIFFMIGIYYSFRYSK